MSLLDFSNIATPQSKFIEEDGTYVGMITKVEEGTSSKKGTPYHRYYVTTLDGKETNITQWCSTNSLPYYKMRLEWLGVNTSVPFNPHTLVGKKIRFIVEFKSEIVVNDLTGVSEVVRDKYPSVDFDKNQEFAQAIKAEPTFEEADVEEEESDVTSFLNNL